MRGLGPVLCEVAAAELRHRDGVARLGPGRHGVGDLVEDVAEKRRTGRGDCKPAAHRPDRQVVARRARQRPRPGAGRQHDRVGTVDTLVADHRALGDPPHLDVAKHARSGGRGGHRRGRRHRSRIAAPPVWREQPAADAGGQRRLGLEQRRRRPAAHRPFAGRSRAAQAGPGRWRASASRSVRGRARCRSRRPRRASRRAGCCARTVAPSGRGRAAAAVPGCEKSPRMRARRARAAARRRPARRAARRRMPR